MYSNGFVVTILKDGTPLREVDGTVTVPFSSEYKIRIKNKTNVDAQFSVFIDGTDINQLGTYVLGAGNTMNLDRFMGSSLHSGKKFKFVSLDDSKVSDPTSSDNGCIEVRLWKRSYTPRHFYTEPVLQTDFLYDDFNNSFNKYSHFYSQTLSYEPYTPAYTVDTGNVSIKSCTIGTPGATVEGGKSNQRFTYASGFDLESVPTIIKLQLVGPTGLSNSNLSENSYNYCPQCGTRRKNSFKYCPRCGRKY